MVFPQSKNPCKSRVLGKLFAVLYLTLCNLCSKYVTAYDTKNPYISTVYWAFKLAERCKTYNIFTTKQNKINGASLQYVNICNNSG